MIPNVNHRNNYRSGIIFTYRLRNSHLFLLALFMFCLMVLISYSSILHLIAFRYHLMDKVYFPCTSYPLPFSLYRKDFLTPGTFIAVAIRFSCSSSLFASKSRYVIWIYVALYLGLYFKASFRCLSAFSKSFRWKRYNQPRWLWATP